MGGVLLCTGLEEGDGGVEEGDTGVELGVVITKDGVEEGGAEEGEGSLPLFLLMAAGVCPPIRIVEHSKIRY